MKRTILVAAIVLFAGLSAAEVGYDGPEDQPHIMGAPDSGSSSQSGASVGPNGTEDKWQADFRQLDATCSSGNHSGIEDISYSGEDVENGMKEVSWTGYIQTPNPCHEAGLTLVEHLGDNSYRLNITTESTGDMCVQCVGVVKYEADFSTEGPFQIEILHDGKKIDTVTYPGYEGGDGEESNSGPLKSLIQWLRNLF